MAKNAEYVEDSSEMNEETPFFRSFRKEQLTLNFTTMEPCVEADFGEVHEIKPSAGVKKEPAAMQELTKLVVACL